MTSWLFLIFLHQHLCTRSTAPDCGFLSFTLDSGNPDIARYLHLALVFPSLLEAVELFVMHLQMNLDFFPVSLLLPSIFMTLRSSETLTAASTANQIMLQIRSWVRNSLQFRKSEIKKALHSCRWAPLLSKNDSAFQVSHTFRLNGLNLGSGYLCNVL